MNSKLRLTAILASILLAACSGNTTTPPLTSDAVDTVGVEDETPVGADTTTEGETTDNAGEGARADFEVTGDITAVVEGEDVYVEQTTAGGDEIYILHIDRADGTQLFIQFPQTSEAGTYTITNVNVNTEGEVAEEPAVTAVLVIPTGGEEVESYLGVTGTLTISEAGETFSGNFQFNASENPSAQPPIQSSSMTADVTGDFENVPLR